MICEHPDAIEADLQRNYGVALSDVFSGRLSWRRLTVLVEHLEVRHATVRAIGNEAAEWSRGDVLLAQAVDALRGANWQRSGGKGRRPKTIEIPGLTEQPTRETHHGKLTVAPEVAAAYLAQFAPPPLEAPNGD